MSGSDLARHVFISHRAALVAYARPMVGSRETAEDVVQDAFLRVQSARLNGNEPEQLLAHLYRVTRNLCFDLLKHRKVRRRCQDQDMPFWIAPPSPQTPEQIMLFQDQIRAVHQVLDTLPLETRIAVEMHRFGGFTLEQVAGHLGISVPTVHRHVRAALVKLALRLQQDV